MVFTLYENYGASESEFNFKSEKNVSSGAGQFGGALTSIGQCRGGKGEDITNFTDIRY